MKKTAVFLFFLLAAAAFLNAAPPVVTVSDFSVESRNPSYEFLGKGLSRLVAGELRKSGAVRLSERENLQKILEEQEFSLSDLADPATQAQVGGLLSAKYLVLGEVIDMAGVVLLSLRMVDVGTGEIVWQDELQERLDTYDYIGAYFAASILKELGAQAAGSTLAKLGRKEEKKAEAVVRLSEGIDAYDKGDQEKARTELKKARAIDPANEVAGEFLSKLETVSPKFRVETEMFSPAYNPASLGFLERDLVFLWSSTMVNAPGTEINPDRIEDQRTGDFWAANFGIPLKVGYAFPLGDRLGVMAEVLTGSYRWLAEPLSGDPFDFGGTDYSFVKDSFTTLGASLSAGVRLSRNAGLGGTFMLWNVTRGPGTEITVDPGLYWAAGGGLMLRWDALSLDASVEYSNQNMYYADLSTAVPGVSAGDIVEGDLPLLAELSLTWELLDQRLFAGLKGIGNFYLDERGGYALRVIPVLEYRPLRFLAVRAGYEYSHFDQAGEFLMGHGLLAGLTLKVKRFDFNVNATYSHIPARILPGYTLDYLTLLVGGTFSPGLLER